MTDKLLLIDVDRCVGCYACEVACRQENELPIGERWCRMVPLGPRKVGDRLHLDFVPTLCIHCDTPICSYFCPSGAITKRKDGVVLIDGEACAGCGQCAAGCPYGAISLDRERGVAGKCSLCVGRVDEGLVPSCVQHCIGGALQFVTEQELAAYGGSIIRGGKTCYTSRKWKLSW